MNRRLFNPKKEAILRSLLHLRTRKSYTLAIPVSFLQDAFPNFGRRHRHCTIEAILNEDKQELRILLEEEKT